MTKEATNEIAEEVEVNIETGEETKISDNPGEPLKIDAPTDEEVQAQIQAQQHAQQMKEQQELQYRAEIKHFSIMLLQGIKANPNRSYSNGKKDVDYVKEAVKNAMLTVNYVNQLPLNFQTPQAAPAPQPAPLKMVEKEEEAASTTEE